MSPNYKLFEHMSKEHGLTLTETELSDIVCVVQKMGKASKRAGIKVPVTLVLTWILGWPLATGFWSTFFAVCFPPWAWYLVAEKIISYLP